MSDEPKRRFRFTLRALLVVMLLLGCLLIPVAGRLHEVRKEKAAVQAIKRLDGKVHYDYEVDGNGRFNPYASFPAPGWARSLLDDDFFRRVRSVEVYQITNVDLEHLKDMKGLAFLRLGGNKLSDAGLAHLSGLSNLEILELRTRVTEEDAAELQNALPKCKILHVLPWLKTSPK